MKNLKYQEPEFYSKIFDESKNFPFEVLPGRTKVGVITKPVPVAPMLYGFQDIKSACV